MQFLSKVNQIALMVLMSTGLMTTQVIASEKTKTPADSADGIPFPIGYQSWQLVSLTERGDNKSMRVVLGNPIAIKAIAEGKTNPWPNGAILAKMVWKEENDPHWPTAKVPGEFVHAEFMFKDSIKWASTGGWGWARWLGIDQKPFVDANHSANATCVACHTPVKNQDWVFHKPALMPSH